MINSILVMSMVCTGIHVLFMEGNLLSPARVYVAGKLDAWAGPKWSKIIQKPLWDCLACMASIWGLLFMGFHPAALLAVSGLNFIIYRLIDSEDEPEALPIHGVTEYHDDIPTLNAQTKTA